MDVRFQLQSVYPHGKKHLHSLSQIGPTAGLDATKKRRSLALEKIEPQFLSPLGRSLITTPTELSQLQNSTPIYTGRKWERLKEEENFRSIILEDKFFTGDFFLRF
jgi:hypothetical protein